jgi:general secretion pathway protein C
MLQVIQGPSKSIWPALCALVLGALAAYTAVAWILQIQSISVAPSAVPNATQAVASSNRLKMPFKAVMWLPP